MNDCCEKCVIYNSPSRKDYAVACSNPTCECHTAHQSSCCGKHEANLPECPHKHAHRDDGCDHNCICNCIYCRPFCHQSSQSIEYGELTTEMIGKATREYLSSQSKGESWEAEMHDTLMVYAKKEGLKAATGASPEFIWKIGLFTAEEVLRPFISKLLSERDNRNV